MCLFVCLMFIKPNILFVCFFAGIFSARRKMGAVKQTGLKIEMQNQFLVCLGSLFGI
ncbi:hypothetical protein Hdeb2414_s0018g00530951 [Helianthus debilis subsp. tardiflorus]